MIGKEKAWRISAFAVVTLGLRHLAAQLLLLASFAGHLDADRNRQGIPDSLHHITLACCSS